MTLLGEIERNAPAVEDRGRLNAVLAYIDSHTRAMIASNAAVAERIERGRSQGVRLLADYLASRVAAGELRPHDCEASARLVFYAVFAAHLSGTPPEPFLPTTIDIVLHGLVAA